LAIIGQHVFFLKQEQHQTMEQLASVIISYYRLWPSCNPIYVKHHILWIHCAPL